MVCYVVSTTSVRVQAAYFDLLKYGVQHNEEFTDYVDYGTTIAARHRESGTSFTAVAKSGGEVEVSIVGENETLADSIKNSVNRAYSHATVAAAAGQHGWTLNRTSQNSYVAVKG